MTMPLNIFLADLLHDNVKEPYYRVVPLNIGLLASSNSARFGKAVSFSLYREVNRFAGDFFDRLPPIVGFSVYIWNVDLTARLCKLIRKRAPGTLIVLGGPLVGCIQEDMENIFENIPEADFIVPMFGEYGLGQLIERYLACDGRRERIKEKAIEGVAFRGSHGEFTYAPAPLYIIPPETVPSPYLTGLLDQFLADGFSPIIQGVRGCPFHCSYCFVSQQEVRQLPAERIIAEIDYIYSKTTSANLAFTDDNFGMFERDLDIARHIRRLYDTRGYPSFLHLYFSKKPAKTVLDILKIMPESSPLYISFQSRNAETLKEIDRYNLDDRDVKKVIEESRKDNIYVASEMIFGLPRETKESFFKGLEEVYRLGPDSINIYNCKLYNGVGLTRRKSMEENRMETRYRLYGSTFGRYDITKTGDSFLSCEAEEIPVSSSSFSYKDFLDIRKLGFWVEMFLTRKFYFEIIKHLESFGVSPFYLMHRIVDGILLPPPALGVFLNRIWKEYEDELFPSAEALHIFVEDKLREDPQYRPPKINLFYMYELIYAGLYDDFDAFIRAVVEKIAREKLSGSGLSACLEPIDELFRFHRNRVVRPEGYDRKKTGIFKYDFPAWERDGFSKPLTDYLLEKEVLIEFSTKIPEQFRALVQENGPEDIPHRWHNYIYLGNIKARASIIKNPES